MSVDIFDRIMSGEVPARIVYKYDPSPDDPTAKAVLVDRNPGTKGHLVTVTRRCVPRWEELPEVEVVQMAVLGQIVARHVAEVYPDADLIYRLTAGNQVRHPHDQYIPRYPDLGHDGDPMRRVHPDSDRMINPPSDAELDAIHARLAFPEALADYTDARMAHIAAFYRLDYLAHPAMQGAVALG